MLLWRCAVTNGPDVNRDVKSPTRLPVVPVVVNLCGVKSPDRITCKRGFHDASMVVLRVARSFLVVALLAVLSLQIILTASSVSAFIAYMPRHTPADLKESPLEFIKGSNGRVLIKMKPDVMARHLISRGAHDDDKGNEGKPSNATSSSLCSTPELKKEYEQLVRSKDQAWSPNLQTISEAKKIRYSPYRLLEWQEKEEDAL
ncbi:hypothetical protein L1887_06837 [Cichorium endivia]|nr:hypothetical protein L1887_06837 [Cichorium endivia]